MSIIIASDIVREPLYCIVPLYNPWRFKSRYKHTMRTIKHFADSGAVVILVEAAFNRRELVFENCGLDGTIAECGLLPGEFRHKYIGLHTKDELWLKECLINTAVSRVLPYNWQQVCWLDGDVQFLRPNWVGECIQKLQHYDWLQMFSHARDLSPNYEMLPETYPHANGMSFMKVYQRGGIEGLRAAYAANNITDYTYGAKPWPGLAWPCTRRAWDAAGGLLDFAIWGGGDWAMAHALVGKRDGMMHSGLHDNYKALVNAWMKHVQDPQYIRLNVGVMEGSVTHFWHGKKTERGYSMKHRLLADIGFDPINHLKRDYQGLWQLHDDGSDGFVQLRDSMRMIARSRDEDSTYTGLEDTDQGH
jgi:hypothetical protein